MIIWIETRLALAIHDRQLAEYGGSADVRDQNMLESALARPQQTYAYGNPPPDIAELAASLAFGLARNHPFVDGNKRTATVCCEVFIRINAVRLKASDGDFYLRILALAEGHLSEADFASWLRQQLCPQQLHDSQNAYTS